MKKLTYLLAASAMLAFSSCEDDKTPVYNAPGTDSATFTLNEPAYANQELVLAEGGTFNMSVYSQPDYGFPTQVQYSAVVALTPEALDPANPQFAEQTRVLTPSSAATDRDMIFKQEDLAIALCELHGFDSDDNYQDLPAAPVYVRAKAQIDKVENTVAYSNVVTLAAVKFYKAFKTPGYVYLVGSPQGWNIGDGSMRLFESDNAIGSKIYSGVFTIDPGDLQFRFYTELGSWGNDGALPSIGAAANDGDNKDFEIPGSAPAMPGKGNWKVDGFAGGEVTFILDMSSDEWTLTVEMGSVTPIVPSYIYMVGNNSGWAEPNEASAAVYESWKLADAEDGVFKATWTIDASQVNGDDGGLYFRFYPELSGWGATPYSSDNGGSDQPADAGTAYTMTTGEGCWVIADAAGKTINFVVDTNTNTFSYTEN